MVEVQGGVELDPNGFCVWFSGDSYMEDVSGGFGYTLQAVCSTVAVTLVGIEGFDHAEYARRQRCAQWYSSKIKTNTRGALVNFEELDLACRIKVNKGNALKI